MSISQGEKKHLSWMLGEAINLLATGVLIASIIGGKVSPEALVAVSGIWLFVLWMTTRLSKGG